VERFYCFKISLYKTRIKLAGLINQENLFNKTNGYSEKVLLNAGGDVNVL